jgi:histone-lysine N-methyltransferase SETMAR
VIDLKKKKLFSIFFKSTGVISISYVDEGKTFDHKWYIENNLKPMVNALNRERPISGTKNVKFHHDNARPHIHKSVINYLEANNFIIMRQPRYSPDLAPSDFWLFDYVKQRLSNHGNVQSLYSEITEILMNIRHKDYLKTFEKWIERIKLCINNKGDYFEHLINKN